MIVFSQFHLCTLAPSIPSSSKSVKILELFTCTFIFTDATNRDNLVHPTRAIQFLVGTRGKNETLAIGGPWSPSLDGPNPESDPSVLIRTAIRVCRALTGIDLSNCTQWHRFLEINYRRQETSSKPARTETTVIFLPDVWSVMPTSDEHSEAKSLYEKSLDAKINPKIPVAPEVLEEPAKIEENPAETSTEAPKETPKETPEETPEEESVQEEEEAEEDVEGENNEEEIDVKSMKVTELRKELESRGLNSKGLKSQLVVRLQKALKEAKPSEEEEGSQEKPEENKSEEKSEKTEDEPEVMEIETSENKKPEIKPVVVQPVKELDEKQKSALKSAYKFPSEPSILVHPHPKAKSGKFECTVMSLSVLLDYRTEDNKENTFEVSLFAELFNEMLMRDSGFKIYKTILQNKPKEESSAEKKEEENDKKIVTKDRDLLLACSYFDLGHCGYFETKDLEDILTTMNLNLSRSQIKKLVTKVTTGKDQQVNYRQFTDKPQESEEIETSEADEETLGQGFKAFLPNSNSKEETSNVVNTVEGICSYRGKFFK